MTPLKTLALAIGSLILLGCPPPQAPPPRPPPPINDPPPGDPPDDPVPDEAQACETGADCESGVCEGGCLEGQGRCASENRACTRDLRPYCGCDSVTFRSSGTCPGRRIAHRGACKFSDNTNPRRADGDACESGADCQSGFCEGQGCGDNNGVCVSPRRNCTADRRPYCGCDGKTFFNSGSCPNRRFARRGEC